MTLMTADDFLVLISGTALILFILWFFFGKKEASEAKISKEKQEVTIIVEGSYSPAEVTVKKGIPVEITFDRRESGDCSEWVIFQIKTKELKAKLAPFAKTKMEFTPMEIGEFPFSCGMGMLHGKLVVKD